MNYMVKIRKFMFYAGIFYLFSHCSLKIIINKMCFVVQYAVISTYIYCIRCTKVLFEVNFSFLWDNHILAFTSRTEMVGLLLAISDLHSKAPSSRLIMHVPMTFWAVYPCHAELTFIAFCSHTEQDISKQSL